MTSVFLIWRKWERSEVAKTNSSGIINDDDDYDLDDNDDLDVGECFRSSKTKSLGMKNYDDDYDPDFGECFRGS